MLMDVDDRLEWHVFVENAGQLVDVDRIVLFVNLLQGLQRVKVLIQQIDKKVIFNGFVRCGRCTSRRVVRT